MANEPGHFRLYEQGGQFFWTLTNDLGLTIATSESFPDKDAALKAAKWVRTKAAACGVIQPPSTAPSIA
jgi:uncharacterized protein YegP (UPF0339 family)